MTIFQAFFGLSARFRLFFGLFLSLFDPGAERPRQPHFRFFQSFLGRGLFDSFLYKANDVASQDDLTRPFLDHCALNL